ncbi:MAG: phenylalanine--tRNA ligase subunit alpha, partial [bacterium]|nr:phenylalanine--tRNA ligase subunit alpha [bacterium]
MDKNVESIKQASLEDIRKAEDLKILDSVRLKYLGRKGRIPALMDLLKGLPPGEKPLFGKKVNSVKNDIQSAVELKRKELESREQKNKSSSFLDVTMPGIARKTGAAHPITQIISEITAIFRRMGFSIADGPDVETEFNNFDALNTPETHPSRDVRDTF